MTWLWPWLSGRDNNQPFSPLDEAAEVAIMTAPMGWATGHIERLKSGETVSFRPTGNSMKPKIESGQLCTVEPVTNTATLVVGDIVLCKVHGNEYLHLIKAIQDQRFLIGNNRGRTNGWIGPHSIFGRLVRVE
jgi:hypothetical protein